jgi:hypothetical protein
VDMAVAVPKQQQCAFFRVGLRWERKNSSDSVNSALCAELKLCGHDCCERDCCERDCCELDFMSVRSTPKPELQSKCGGRAVGHAMGIVGGIVEVQRSNWAIEVVDAVTEAAAAVGLNVGFNVGLGWSVVRAVVEVVCRYWVAVVDAVVEAAAGPQRLGWTLRWLPVRLACWVGGGWVDRWTLGWGL